MAHGGPRALCALAAQKYTALSFSKSSEIVRLTELLASPFRSYFLSAAFSRFGVE